MKILINNKQIIFQDYKNIKLISQEKIIIDNFSINGYKLSISSMDDYSIIINGIFDVVNFNEKG